MYVCVYIYNIHSPWGYVEPVAAGYWGFGVSAFDLRGARVPRSNLGAGKFHQGCCFFFGGGRLYYSYHKEHQISIGNYFGPCTFRAVTGAVAIMSSYRGT